MVPDTLTYFGGEPVDLFLSSPILFDWEYYVWVSGDETPLS
jgi:hypothetical protein